MNKKGFTIVELVISIVLLSIVMVFMLTFMSELRGKEDVMEEDTDMLLNTTIISKKINEDILKRGGVNSINCTTTDCEFNFKNNKNTTLTLTNNMKTINYTEGEEKILVRTLPNEEAQYKDIVISEFELDYGTLRKITIDITNFSQYKIEILSY